MAKSQIDLIERNSGAQAPLSDGYRAARRFGFADVLREHRRSRPNDLAAVDGALRLTWRDLDARVNRLTAALVKHGLVCGDRILWLGQNSVKLFEVMLAAARSGAFVVPANWRMSVAETRAVVDDLDPRIVFWQHAEIGDNHRAVQVQESRGRFWCQHDGTDADCFDALLSEGLDEDRDLDIDPELPMLGIYTAAFEGRAGAALLSHTALMLQGLVCAQGQGIVPNSRYLVSGPMFHVGVLMGAIGAFMRGAVQVFAPRIDAEDMMRTIAAERVTHAYIPQPTALAIQHLAAGSSHDLSSLFADGDPAHWRSTLVMPPDAPAAAMPGGYGQTELAGYLTQPWFGGEGAGRPHPLAQVMIVDDDGNELPPGETGEIVVRGPMVMCGYYNRPDQNARRSLNGWHRTLDLGRRNGDGSLSFVGPKTRMIKSGSENIYPIEIERCLVGHDGVAAACVIGVPDAEWDQNVKAIIVRRAGSLVDAADLTAHCRAHIASYKKPRFYEFVDALPLLDSGEPDRDRADALYGGGGYPSRGNAS